MDAQNLASEVRAATSGPRKAVSTEHAAAAICLAALIALIVIRVAFKGALGD